MNRVVIVTGACSVSLTTARILAMKGNTVVIRQEPEEAVILKPKEPVIEMTYFKDNHKRKFRSKQKRKFNKKGF